MRNGICLSLEETWKATDTEVTSFSVESRYEKILFELCSREALQSLPEWVREYALGKEMHVQDVHILLKIVKSRIASGEFLPLLSDYNSSENEISISDT